MHIFIAGLRLKNILPTLMAKCNFVTFNFVLTESLIVTKPFDFFVINLN